MSATSSARRSPSLSAGLLLGATLLASLGAFTPGCGRARARECASTITAINEGVKKVDDFEAERRTKPLDSTRQTGQQMEQLSALYQAQHDRTAPLALTLTDKQLKAELDDYNGQVQRAVGGTHLLASGIGSNLPQNASQGDATYADAVKKQKDAIGRINAYCAAP